MRRWWGGVLGALLLAGSAAAQDRHEWHTGFGEHGQLLGGSITGSVRDPSAVYYNPAALAYVREVGITATGTALGYERLELDGVAGTDRGMVASDLRWSPTMLAGVFHPMEERKQMVAFTVLMRSQTDLRVNGRAEAIVDIVSGLPGPERFTGVFEKRARVDEVWLGISSAATFLDDHLALGVTQFVTVRSGLASTLIDATAFNPFSGGNAISRDHQRLEYLTLGLAWKLGAAFDMAPFRAGLTLTPPSVHLWGQGDLLYQQASAGVDTTGDSFADPFDVALFDDRAEARWRRSAAVGFGGSVDIAEWRVHLGLEWSTALGDFTVVRTNASVNATTIGGLPNEARHQQRGVLNGGVGVERAVNEAVRAFLSFRTDFSTGPDGDDSAVTLAQWDLFHVAGGAAWKLEHATLWLGVTFTFGSGTLDQPANYATANEPTRLFGGPSEGDVLYFGLQITAAYTYQF